MPPRKLATPPAAEPAPEPAPKRKPGRPKNAEVHALAEELAVSQRQAQRLRREGATGSPIAAARLAKIEQETRLIKLRIAAERREAKVRSGELIEVETAKRIMGAPHRAAAETIKGMPRQIAGRLVGLPVVEIEKTLAAWADSLLDLLRRAGE